MRATAFARAKVCGVAGSACAVALKSAKRLKIVLLCMAEVKTFLTIAHKGYSKLTQKKAAKASFSTIAGRELLC
jgi:hypothetical protein